MTYRSSINPFDKTDYSNFAFKKAEILEILQALDSSFAFDQVILDTQIIENISSAVSYVRADYDYKFFLFKKPLLTFHEASCIMTGYDPQLVEQCQNDTSFKQNFSDYLGAKDYIDVCTDAQMLCYNSMDNRIYAEDFKKFLANDGTFINGFNDDLKISTSLALKDNINFQEKISDLEFDLIIERATVDKLNKENTKLKTELLEKEQKIKEFEQLNLNADSDLPDLSVEQLTGLAKRNQLAQDRQGMARIIALSFWEKDQNILIGDMADRVYRTMIDYCKDDLPQLTDTLKSWIRPVATEEAQKKGRPKSSS